MKMILLNFKNKIGLYQKKKKIEISQELTHLKFNENENNLMKHVTDNIKICRYFYNILYNLVPEKFFDLLSLLSFTKIKDINENFWFSGWGLKSSLREYAGSTKLLRSNNFFSYINRRFPSEKKLGQIIDGKISHFLKNSRKKFTSSSVWQV